MQVRIGGTRIGAVALGAPFALVVAVLAWQGVAAPVLAVPLGALGVVLLGARRWVRS